MSIAVNENIVAAEADACRWQSRFVPTPCAVTVGRTPLAIVGALGALASTGDGSPATGATWLARESWRQSTGQPPPLAVKPARVPWNKGRLVGSKPPVGPSQAADRGQVEEPRVVQHATGSKLRGCDVVAVKGDDVAPGGYSLERVTRRPKKTGRAVQLLLGRSKIGITVPCLGIEVNDALEIAEKIDICSADAISQRPDTVDGAFSVAARNCRGFGRSDPIPTVRPPT